MGTQMAPTARVSRGNCNGDDARGGHGGRDDDGGDDDDSGYYGDNVHRVLEDVFILATLDKREPPMLRGNALP